jgi:4'-phosphopantetheinyl transferase
MLSLLGVSGITMNRYNPSKKDPINGSQGKWIANEDLHIWSIPIAAPCPDPLQAQPQTEVWQQLLSKEERQRLNRFSHPDSQYNYLYSRVALRNILSGYLKTSARELALIVSPLGKPQVAPDTYPLDLRFNLSHTRGLALLAVTRGQEVGIDIEMMGRQRNIKALALRYFAPTTNSELSMLTAERQEEAFLQLWTQFEAYKKAKGEGLRGGDKCLPLSLYAPPDEQFYYLLPEGYAQKNWQAAVLNLKSHDGYICSVVAERRSMIKHFQFRAGMA